MMMSLFLLGYALAALPGPDFFLITSNTLSAGRSIGYFTLAGNRVSLCIHICIAILGLAIILRHSQALFLTVSVLGGVYLAYLGWNKIRACLADKYHQSLDLESSLLPKTAFRQGFLTNLINPKVSLFFLSLFPQFASTELLQQSPLTVALVFFIGNTLWWLPLIFVIGYPRIRLVFQKFQKWLDFAFGIMFLFYGIRVIVVSVL